MRAEAARRGLEARSRAGTLPPWLQWGGAGLIVGLIIGLFWAWQVSPVVLTDVDPQDLRESWQQEWLQMTAQSLGQTGDVETARQRLEGFSDAELSDLLNDLFLQSDETTRQQLVPLGAVRGISPTAIDTSTVAPEPAAGGGSLIRNVGLGCGGLLALILLGLGAFVVWTRFQQAGTGTARNGTRRRRERAATYQAPDSEEPPMTDIGFGAADEYDEVARELSDVDLEESEFREIGFGDEDDDAVPDDAAWTRPPTAARAAPGPLHQFTARYNLGDKDYDINVVIETPNAEFLGECGVSVREALDDGDVQRVTALEIWLFDKDDIRTVTKVLLSEYAAADEAVRTRLAPKGELAEAQEGETVELETASLRVQARLREVAYGWEPEYPQKSYFERVVIELVPFQKGSTAGRPAIEY
ncbi:MAG TPA: hypothetical protein VER55_12595 [Ardenticatenaceae bacterium]|nr:hypothetical protein [Ardenticatenaceae bacterium]